MIQDGRTIDFGHYVALFTAKKNQWWFYSGSSLLWVLRKNRRHIFVTSDDHDRISQILSFKMSNSKEEPTNPMAEILQPIHLIEWKKVEFLKSGGGKFDPGTAYSEPPFFEETTTCPLHTAPRRLSVPDCLRGHISQFWQWWYPAFRVDSVTISPWDRAHAPGKEVLFPLLNLQQ